MNKTTKASIATAAGIVLLLGGGASLAYWNSSADLGATNQTIKAGTLTVTAGNGQWDRSFWSTPTTEVTSLRASNVTLGQQLIVPGNKLTYTQTFTIDAQGQDLFFTLTPTSASLGASPVIANLTISPVTVSGLTQTSGTISGPTAGVYHVTTANGVAGATFTATYTVTWPFGTLPASNSTGDNADKGKTVTLTNGAIVLTQVVGS